MSQIKSAATLACSLALVVGSSPAMAQQTQAPPGAPGARLDAIRKVSTLIGTKVVNQANSTIADIRDLVLAPDGTGTYAILGFGGIAGVDANYTAIPWQDLNLRQTDGKWVANLNMTSDALAKAPTFKTNTYQELTDPQWVSSVENFFHTGAGARARPTPRPIESVLLASKVRGAKLRNSQNEDLGKIEDLLLDRAFRVAFAIVGHGGVLGIGESYIPVPWSKLTPVYDRSTGSVTTKMEIDKARLERAPLVKGNYEQMLAPGFVDQVNRHFGETPPSGR